MKLFLVTLLAAAAVASPTEQVIAGHSAYGYITKYGIPNAERIQKAEEEYLNNPSRIVGGSPAALGQYPYQVCNNTDFLSFHLFSKYGTRETIKNIILLHLHQPCFVPISGVQIHSHSETDKAFVHD